MRTLRKVIEEVAWSPFPKQVEFLEANELEVCYGGTVWSGKTDGLLVDALGIDPDAEAKTHVNRRAYQAILFRRTFPDLKDLIDRSELLYKDFDPKAQYDKQQHVWRFPRGARIEFGHIGRDVERFRYRGRHFQYIGWEELTLWPTSAPYLYLLSRLFTSDPEIMTMVRSTTNPDGPGFRWVKDYFRIPDSGKGSRFTLLLRDPVTGQEFERARRFIPALPSDNPHVSAEQRGNLLLMDADDQDRLMRGLWRQPKIKGAIYGAEMRKAKNEGRICKVPYAPNVPVDTYWDFGVGGSTSIWLGQHVALQQRFLACFEDAGKPLNDYVRWLLERKMVFGTHHLPHDADTRRLGMADVRSWKQMLQELMPGHKFVVVPRIPDIDLGISMTKDKMGDCYFDEEDCAEGVAALENYRRIVDEELGTEGAPLEDWTCHYADAFRQFGQAKKRTAVTPPPVQPFRPADRGMGY